MRVYSKLPVGEFVTLGHGHAFATEDSKPGELVLGHKLQLVCMFTIHELLQDGKRIGFYFESGFTTINKSGHLLTFMEAKRGRATTSDLVLRDDQGGLIVIDYCGAGALAISTKVSSFVNDILEVQ